MTEFIARIESSFARLAPNAEELVHDFYASLFAAAPQVRSLFPEQLDGQAKKLVDSLALVANHVGALHMLAAPLRALGQRHVAYGARPEHYGLVRDTLVAVMARHAEGWWTEQLTADWTQALDLVAGAMLAGASEGSSTSPTA